MAYRSGSVVTAGDASGTSLTGIARPAGEQDGDILELLFYGESDAALTLSVSPGTWTQHETATNANTAPDMRIYRLWNRRAGETATIDITWGGADIWRTAILAAYTGRLESGDPQDATGTNNTGSGATVTALGVTTGNDDADLVMTAGNIIGGTHSSPAAPITERADFGGQFFGDGAQVSAGASGNKTVTQSGTGEWTATLTAIRAASGAAPTGAVRARQRMFMGVGR